MAAQRQSQEFVDRTERFGRDTILYCRSLILDRINGPLASQLVRAATSVGANYAEAQNAVSRADFRNKIGICKKEAQEVKYWLRMLETSTGNSGGDLKGLQVEAHEIVLILQSIYGKLNLQPKLET